MRIIALIILLLATECSAQVPIFRAATKRPSASVDVTPRAQTNGTTPAADISELLIKRGEVINLVGDQNEFTIVMCTATWCQPCRNFKASSEYQRILKRFPLELADIDKFPAWRPLARRVPTFWIIRTSNRDKLRKFEGVVTLKQLEIAVEEIRNPQPKVNNGVTQRELIDLHNRLHGGGQWTWPGNLRDHLRSVHGVAL